MRTPFLLLVATFFAVFCQAQTPKKGYRVAIVGFYNLENLFDTAHNEGKNDWDFTPSGPYKYNTWIYRDKLNRLSDVLSQIGTEVSPDGLSMFGVAEIEDSTVLHDLARTEKLRNRNYQFVHYESPDERGIDVGLMYNPRYLKVLWHGSYAVDLRNEDGTPYFTRDVLYVKGLFAGTDTVHVFVNHWPSRRGGEERSAASRARAAQTCRTRIDSIMALNPDAKVLVMGDLNDDPVSPSVTEVMQAKGKLEEVGRSDIYNPWIGLYKRGIGTLAYQDSWGLFDQIMISGAWLNKDQRGFFYKGATIYNKDFLIQKTGKFRGYPKRTWDGITYNYGYSDHFPVYITLLKAVE